MVGDNDKSGWWNAAAFHQPLGFLVDISFVLFLFIIKVEIPFYEVVDTGF